MEHFGVYDKLASMIRNNLVSGLQGYHHNSSINLEQIKDDIIITRLQIIKEYSLKGILPVKDLLLAINCIDVDCKSLERCKCNSDGCETIVAHFEIPQLLNDYGSQAIDYIGTTDRQIPFVWYTSATAFRYSKYRKRGKNKPKVYIDTTPNENGMYDCFIFNAPLIKQVSVVAIFKDPRQLERYGCCQPLNDDNFTFLNKEIESRLSKELIYYYRQLAMPNLPNDQSYKP